ncbi:unnamed protein product [Choristocarpus tenellus]
MFNEGSNMVLWKFVLPMIRSLHWVKAAFAELVLVRLGRTILFALVGDCHPPHPGDNVISAEWLSLCLLNHKLISKDKAVASVELQGLDGNRGLSGCLAKLHITYTEAAFSGPSTLILKCVPFDHLLLFSL